MILGELGKRRGVIWLTVVNVVALVALGFAFYTGTRYDYSDQMSLWELILAGEDPWSTFNVYGPAFNLIAIPFAYHPLMPKAIFVCVWIACCWYLIHKLMYRNIGLPWLAFWLVAIPFNPLYWIFIVTYGSFDALVAGLCLLTLVLRQDDRHSVAGFVLALAILLKFYPICIFPFLALDGRRINWRFVVAVIVTVTIGFYYSIVTWGDSPLTPLMFAATRVSKTFSIFRFLGGNASPLQAWTMNVDHLSLPAMVLAGGTVFILSQKWRLPPVSGALVGLLTTLALYKAGAIQYFLIIPIVVGYWYALRLPHRDWFLTSTLIACLVLLAGMAVLYETTRPPGVERGMSGSWGFLRDWVGLPTFVTLASFLAALMRHERRATLAVDPVATVQRAN